MNEQPYVFGLMLANSEGEIQSVAYCDREQASVIVQILSDIPQSQKILEGLRNVLKDPRVNEQFNPQIRVGVPGGRYLNLPWRMILWLKTVLESKESQLDSGKQRNWRMTAIEHLSAFVRMQPLSMKLTLRTLD